VFGVLAHAPLRYPAPRLFEVAADSTGAGRWIPRRRRCPWVCSRAAILVRAPVTSRAAVCPFSLWYVGGSRSSCGQAASSSHLPEIDSGGTSRMRGSAARWTLGSVRLLLT